MAAFILLLMSLITAVFAVLPVDDTLSLTQAKFAMSTSSIFVLNSSILSADVSELAAGPPYLVVTTSNSSASFLAFMMFNISNMIQVPTSISSETQYFNQTVSKIFWVQGNLTAAESLRFEPMVAASNMQLANLTSAPLIPYTPPNFLIPSVNATLSIWEQTPSLMSFLNPTGTINTTILLPRLYALAISSPALEQEYHVDNTLTNSLAHSSLDFTITNSSGSYSAPEETLSSTAATIQTGILSSSSVVPSSSSFTTTSPTTTSSASATNSATGSTSTTTSSTSQANTLEPFSVYMFISATLITGLFLLLPYQPSFQYT